MPAMEQGRELLISKRLAARTRFTSRFVPHPVNRPGGL
jgi:hypothetical protein